MHPNLAQLTEYFLVEKTQRIANNTLHIKIIFNPPPPSLCLRGFK